MVCKRRRLCSVLKGRGFAVQASSSPTFLSISKGKKEREKEGERERGEDVEVKTKKEGERGVLKLKDRGRKRESRVRERSGRRGEEKVSLREKGGIGSRPIRMMD
jgi:hypothetical protein